MAKQHKAQWELQVRGKQRERLEADLLGQIVIMLGRQLSQETMTDTGEPGNGAAPATSGEGVVS